METAVLSRVVTGGPAEELLFEQVLEGEEGWATCPLGEKGIQPY